MLTKFISHVDTIDMLHVNIITLHVEIIFLACRGGGGGGAKEIPHRTIKLHFNLSEARYINISFRLKLDETYYDFAILFVLLLFKL